MAQMNPALKNSKLVIASHNEGKVAEIRQLLAPMGVDVLSAAELDLAAPTEDGSTFAENAKIKSCAASAASGLPALADDSGLVIPALNGAPGIYSSRWAGDNQDFTVAINKIYDELRQVGIEDYNDVDAYFTCVLSLTLANGDNYSFTGKVEGKLCYPPRGDNGFGYDPIFIPNGYKHSFAEMELKQKQRISHRSQAFGKLQKWLQMP